MNESRNISFLLLFIRISLPSLIDTSCRWNFTGNVNDNNGNVDKRKKMNAKEMYNELVNRANQGDLDKEDIPKVSTIRNWIAKTAASFKIQMSERILEETEASSSAQ